VKGDNLTEALNKITDAIFDLNSLVNSILLEQMQFNLAVSSGPIQGQAGPIPVVSTMPLAISTGQKVNNMLQSLNMDVILQRNKLKSLKFDFLTSSGADYICSKYNRTN
jgi:hypothetical protein